MILQRRLRAISQCPLYLFNHRPRKKVYEYLFRCAIHSHFSNTYFLDCNSTARLLGKISACFRRKECSWCWRRFLGDFWGPAFALIWVDTFPVASRVFLRFSVSRSDDVCWLCAIVGKNVCYIPTPFFLPFTSPCFLMVVYMLSQVSPSDLRRTCLQLPPLAGDRRNSFSRRNNGVEPALGCVVACAYQAVVCVIECR